LKESEGNVKCIGEKNSLHKAAAPQESPPVPRVARQAPPGALRNAKKFLDTWGRYALVLLLEKQQDSAFRASRQRGVNTMTKPHSPAVLWDKGDVFCGFLAGLISFAVYAWTAAPNVTLLDSGEFTVAAMHFGVPHPTGYPLWTFLTWLFTLLPLGNAAWEVNIFSGVCGALAVGLLTMLARSSLRWLLGEELKAVRGLLSIIAVTSGLLFAFSLSMWSQATIAEVYTLQALGIGLFLTVLYAWLRKPERLSLLVLSFFVLALAFSNHHLTLVMAGLPFIAVLLVRRDLFWDLVVAACLTALLAYLGFAILSQQQAVLHTALRFFYCVALGLLVLVVVRRGHVEWRLVAYLPFAVVLGMLPYAYMPLASSTNPPMNWSYTRTSEGFFYSFNRSQYGGTLSDQSLRTLGRLMGTMEPRFEKPKPPLVPGVEEKSLFSRVQEWAGFFWAQLAVSFTLLGVLGYFGALFVIFRLEDVARRTWIYLLQLAFVLAAILQPVMDAATIDVGGWWVQMPYHTYTNFIFALLMAFGFALGTLWIARRFPRFAWIRFALLALPLAPLIVNEAQSSQRNRWFGWQFGYDMLNDLPRGSVVFGGTDPGRFVPTYMILGESGQESKHKRDGNFDRRDLFIITQNGVGEPLYRKYIADHYGPNRPQATTAFERWLGRSEIYPKETLNLPTDEEVQAAVENALKPEAGTDITDPTLYHAAITKLIWEKNREKHPFFVEESFVMKWSYDYALPHGLSYQIAKDKLKEIPADVVAKDMAFWGKYVRDLLANPEFSQDLDAQRSFSKLRNTTGNIYRHWKMDKEAEHAYREALSLWPANPESLTSVSSMLWDRGDFDAALALMDPANESDPNNAGLWRLRFFTEKRKELEGEIRECEAILAQQSRGRETVEKLLGLYASVGETNKSAALMEKSTLLFKDDPDFLRKVLAFAKMQGLKVPYLKAALNLVAADDQNATNHYLLAAAHLESGDTNNFYLSARRAIDLGGVPFRESFQSGPEFTPLRETVEFQSLLTNSESPAIRP